MPEGSGSLLRVVLPLVAHNPQAGRYALEEPRFISDKVPPRCGAAAKAFRDAAAIAGTSRGPQAQSDHYDRQCEPQQQGVQTLRHADPYEDSCVPA